MDSGHECEGSAMEYLTPTFTAVALAVLVAVVGMPHGGLDHRFGREVFRSLLGRYWLVGFGLAYLGTAGLVLAGWFFFPLLTIVLFFLISAVHFGDDVGIKQPLRAVEGGMVIWVPLLFRPSEVAELLTWVVPSGDVQQIGSGIAAVEPLLWALAVFFITSLLWSNTLEIAARKLAFALLFAVAPTLVSFAVYFCGWHSTRELAELARRADPMHPWRGLRRVMKLAAPMAAVAVTASCAAAWYFASGRGLHTVVVQAVFLGLSAVAVPHILLHAVARRMGSDPFSHESGVLHPASHSERVLA